MKHDDGQRQDRIL